MLIVINTYFDLPMAIPISGAGRTKVLMYDQQQRSEHVKPHE